MNHADWKDLIPFYIAGTLSKTEMLQLERHLAECISCRQDVNDWQTIGDAVRAEAEVWSRGLPPLSTHVREYTRQVVAKSSNGVSPPQSSVATSPRNYPVVINRRVASRQFRAPVTLVASVVVALVVGGLLIFSFMRNERDLDEDNGLEAASLLHLSATPANTYSTVTPRPTEQTDLGILPVPSATPLPPTMTLAPTPLPPRVSPTVQSETLSLAPTTFDGCSVSAATDEPVDIYAFPDTIFEVTGKLVPGEFLQTWVYDGGDWYQVVAPGVGLLGWVNRRDIELHGDCGNVVLPTATALSMDLCIVSPASGDGINLYAGPGQEYDILNTITQSNEAIAIARNESSWYRVRYTEAQSVWVGWVNIGNVTLTGSCDSLPVLASPELTPTSSPLEP
jgi:hypothetical protein